MKAGKMKVTQHVLSHEFLKSGRYVPAHMFHLQGVKVALRYSNISPILWRQLREHTL